jgi:hypothetical protein
MLFHQYTFIFLFRVDFHSFFNNITNQSEESIEKRLARRQLAIKLNPSASWFIEIKKLLFKYELQDPIFMMDNPNTKNETI